MSRDIADQGAWVGMPRARLEHWSNELGNLDESAKRAVAAQLVVLARGLRQALHERGTMAVLQLVTLVRHMLGERVDISLMLDVGDERRPTPHLSLVRPRPPRAASADEARRFFEMMKGGSPLRG